MDTVTATLRNANPGKCGGLGGLEVTILLPIVLVATANVGPALRPSQGAAGVHDQIQIFSWAANADWDQVLISIMITVNGYPVISPMTASGFPLGVSCSH